MKLKVALVFEAWGQVGDIDGNFQGTELECELKMGQLHGGTTFYTEIELPDQEAQEILDAWREHQAFPSFVVLDPEPK
jgi:hypothetical protein